MFELGVYLPSRSVVPNTRTGTVSDHPANTTEAATHCGMLNNIHIIN